MKVHVLGAGPGGLYASLLLKKAHPSWEIALWERNPAGATYGWGVVFSDRTLRALQEADAKTYTQITDSFVLWDAIDVHVKEQLVRCEGHVFAGMARRHLLHILQERCGELGVGLNFGVEVDDPQQMADADLVIAADGVNSKMRTLHAPAFKPRVTEGATRFIWFGTDKLFDAFTFIFRENEHGLFQVHAYPFDGRTGTFIVECGEATWERAGLDQADEATSLAYCERLFADHLRGCHLLSNYSRWLCFATVKNAHWYHGNVVLLGDAAHTAHFSIGSGTKLAMEDAIALATAFHHDITLEAALQQFEQARKPKVEVIQTAARESQQYFEQVVRYRQFDPIQFTFHLLTRSGRISYDNLKQRDPYFMQRVDRWFAETHGDRRPQSGPLLVAPPALFTPLKLRGMRLLARVVSLPAPTYGAQDGLPSAEYGECVRRHAASGAGLVLTAQCAIAADARITSGCAGLYQPAHLTTWASTVAAIHEQSSAKVALELNHAGRRGATRPRSRGLDVPLPDGNWPLLSASALPYSSRTPLPKAMDSADMELVRGQFVTAAQLAAEAGFDLLQLNAAHGYLLASFLSPLTNKRTDCYGGSLAARMRFPLEVFDAVRACWPGDRPLAVAINASDWARDGVTLADTIVFARTLRKHGCDLLTIVAGQTVPDMEPNYDPAAFAQYSDVLRNEVGIATLMTGYLTTEDHVNTLLAGGRADLCLFNPPHMNL